MNKQKEKFEIGVVTINYGLTGDPTFATFTPTAKVRAGKELLQELGKFEPTRDPEKIKEDAAKIFGEWWAVMNKVELADRNLYQIKSDVGRCVKVQNGTVKSCEVRFTFEPIEQGVKEDLT